MIRKKTKIYDCFFYLDEIEILNFRLNLLRNHVDHFIIIEIEQNFLLESKTKFLESNDFLNDVESDKITILKIPSLDEKKIIDKYNRHRTINSIFEIEKNGMKGKDLQKFALFELLEYLMTQDLLLEDLIFVSDVDEIPDFQHMNEMKELLIYGPLFLKNKNFVWSDKFKLPTSHEGSILFNFSHILSSNTIFQRNYFAKNKFRSRKNSINCGWHLSHFYDIERTYNKFKLLHPEKEITKKLIIDSFSKLEYPIKNVFGATEHLIENEIPLPFSTGHLPKPYLGRRKTRKILVRLSTNTKIDTNNFDKIIDFKIDEKFLPKSKIYNNSEFFYTINEIPNYLKNEFLLNQDLIYVILEPEVSDEELNCNPTHIDEKKRFVIFEWKTLKKNILSDLIFF